MIAIDLEYDRTSLLPPPRRERIAAFESYISNYSERETRFPEPYIAHVMQCHGGVPGKKCFTTASGTCRFVGRFLNFLTEEDIGASIIPTWRIGVDRSRIRPADDIRLDYSIWRNSHDSAMHWERLGIHLVPFAGIDTAGHDCRSMAEFDLVCFDYERGDEPSVVTWSFHESFEDDQVTELVADTFDAFLTKLHRCRDSFGAAHEQVDTF